MNLDLAVEDLHERLKAGKTYPPQKVAHALESFFQQETLSTLRELALKEVAPHAATLLRRGSRMAGRLNTEEILQVELGARVAL